MTVQKRRVDRSETEARAVADIAAWVAHMWPTYRGTEAAKAKPTMRAGGAPGRSSEVPDPTHAIVASLAHYDETCEAVAAWLAQGRWIQARMRETLRDEPELARQAAAEASRMRCSGEVDPTCTRNAVRKGLCWRCYRTTLEPTEAAS